MIKYIFLTALGLILFLRMSATDPSAEVMNADQVEQYILSTDRSYYITGEIIRFRAFNRSSEQLRDLPFSRILYVQLISPRGENLARTKIQVDRDGGSGAILIPSAISSGTYYLEAYSRDMRNCGVGAFSYTSLRIIDPFKESVVSVDTSGEYIPDLSSDIVLPETANERSLEIVSGEGSYHNRERVDFSLKIDGASSGMDACISVAMPGVHGIQERIQQGCRINIQELDAYLPEIQGISISGKIVNRQNQLPVPYATVYVSVLGDNRNFLCNYADSAGRFFVSFPDYRGEKELFVSAYHEGTDDLELLIDQDFNTEPVKLPSPSLVLRDSLRILVRALSINAQVADQYYPVRVQDNPPPDNRKRLFYGDPTSTIRLDEFIKLPRLEEYFFELIPQVAVRKQGGKRRLVIRGNHTDLELYPPLLMIDGVAIFDVEALLAVSPRLVDRIEIVNAPYIRGNVTFGGIISVITRNNDLGYIDLPSSGLLVNYQFLQEKFSDRIPDLAENQNLPDVRNTLYWDPSIRIEAGEEVNAGFMTPDIPGTYEIVIEGFTDDGQFLRQTGTVEVL